MNNLVSLCMFNDTQNVVQTGKYRVRGIALAVEDDLRLERLRTIGVEVARSFFLADMPRTI